MSKKVKIKGNETKKELLKILEQLKDFPRNEIPFTLIKKYAEALGANHCIKKERGKGSSERFKHDYVRAKYFSIHIIHKGGNMVLVRKNDFKDYLYTIFKEITENTL